MLPEIIVAVTAFVVIGLELTLPAAQKRFLSRLTLLGLAGALFAMFALMTETDELFGGQFVLDPVSAWFKVLLIIAAGLSVAVAVDHLDGEIQHGADESRDLGHRGEFLSLVMFNLVGMMLLSSARDLICLYISLELATIPLYLLVAWRKRSARSIESGMKYVVLGAMSSGVLLFGLGILYGLSGTMNLAGIAAALDGATPALWLAIAMVTAGLGFKLALVPFHLWAAEVYHGAAAPVTAYLSVASKCAGLAFMFQLFYRVLGGVVGDLGQVIALVAALAMTLGNVVAIVQHNIKRFMAFSSISQAGYLI
ncbi:MAG: NADH-quinone oxidoreductase subunit N, partial [Planctomycetota bacterium]